VIGYRSTRVPVLVAAVVLSGIALVTASRAHPPHPRPTLTASSAEANSHWQWCNEEAVSSAPAVLWSRIQSATESHSDIPSSFWTDVTYRDAIAKIVCYESTFNYHAENVGQYGWFQMNQPLIESEGVSWSQYWYGTLSTGTGAGWYQCTAGERYMHGRYRNPAVAWLHEEVYGWY
jgi:hypothetical protein